MLTASGSHGRLGPRIVVAGTHSGVGKTTVATGVMAALAHKGLRIAGAKVGPDFIDPGFHALATGRPGRNLDPWLCGREAIAPLAALAGAASDVLVVEGVMGMYDGASFDTARASASTAEVAGLISAPVVLVVDASGMSTSVAALVQGYAGYASASGETAGVQAVILNRVSSDRHETMLREALVPTGVPVLGALRRTDSLTWRERHLGLVPVIEQPGAVRRSLELLGDEIRRRCDLEAIVRLASSAPSVAVSSPGTARPSGRARVAVAGEPAFSFVYGDNLERLEEAGAELLPFDPLTDARLPRGAQALYAGGGFPEAFLPALAANRELMTDVRRAIAAGLPTWAECGGMLWLARTLDGQAMCGALEATAEMTRKLTLGYRRARVLVDTPVAEQGCVLRGHEFRYSRVQPAGDALDLEGSGTRSVAGFGGPSLLASYIHVHLGAEPAPAERLVSCASASRA